MRIRFVLPMLALAAMVAVLGGQESPQAPPREFTNSAGMKFILIDSATFHMGSDVYGPAHDVTLSKGFYLQETAVTYRQWKAVMSVLMIGGKFLAQPFLDLAPKDAEAFIKRLCGSEERRVGKECRYR